MTQNDPNRPILVARTRPIKSNTSQKDVELPMAPKRFTQKSHPLIMAEPS